MLRLGLALPLALAVSGCAQIHGPPNVTEYFQGYPLPVSFDLAPSGPSGVAVYALTNPRNLTAWVTLEFNDTGSTEDGFFLAWVRDDGAGDHFSWPELITAGPSYMDPARSCQLVFLREEASTSLFVVALWRGMTSPANVTMRLPEGTTVEMLHASDAVGHGRLSDGAVSGTAGRPAPLLWSAEGGGIVAFVETHGSHGEIRFSDTRGVDRVALDPMGGFARTFMIRHGDVTVEGEGVMDDANGFLWASVPGGLPRSWEPETISERRGCDP